MNMSFRSLASAALVLLGVSACPSFAIANQGALATSERVVAKSPENNAVADIATSIIEPSALDNDIVTREESPATIAEQAASALAFAAALKAEADLKAAAAAEAATLAAQAASAAADAAAKAEAAIQAEAIALAAAAPPEVELISTDGLVSVTGVITAFDEKLITVKTSFGVVGIENDQIECIGVRCPSELLSTR